jgi:ubiquinone/menaquinone biosynthesis C-methylase UbiE
MTLRYSYTLLAPVYDLFVAAATESMRRDSLAAADFGAGSQVLIVGIGSGLDIPHLPKGPVYTGVDITPAMLARARRRAARHGVAIELAAGDAMALAWPDATFDAVVMHLILAVVPRPRRALAEAARVLRPGGRLLILDKFLRPGQRAPLRRIVSPLLARIATRTDVEFEPLHAACPALTVIDDTPLPPLGWFRRILLHKS